MTGFRSTNIPNFTKIIELFMIVYNMPIVFRKMYTHIFYQKNDVSLSGREKPIYVFRQWVENYPETSTAHYVW